MQAFRRQVLAAHRPTAEDQELEEALGQVHPDMQERVTKLTDYAFNLKDVLVDAPSIAQGCRQAEQTCRSAANDVHDKDKGSKISTLTTSSINVVGGVLTCIPVTSPIGLGITVASSASQIAAREILEAQIRDVYNSAKEDVAGTVRRVERYGADMETVVNLRNEAADVWEMPPAWITDGAAKMIVAFKVLNEINRQNGYTEVIQREHCFSAMLMMFHPDTPAARIVMQVLQNVPVTQMNLPSMGGGVDGWKVVNAMIPVVTGGLPKALVVIGKLVAKWTALSCCANWGAKVGSGMARAGLSSSLGKMLVGVGLICDIATIVTTAIHFDSPHVAEQALTDMANSFANIAQVMEANAGTATETLRQIDDSVNEVMAALQTHAA